MDFLVPKLRKAIEFSVLAHKNQIRKNGDMYIVHPISVALIISKYTEDVDVLCASLLHDVLEENAFDDYYDVEIRKRFGFRVYRIVKELTDDFGASWEERKLFIEKKLEIMSKEAFLIKSADTIDNISNMIEIVRNNDELTYSKFTRSHKEMIEMYKIRNNLFKKHYPENPLQNELDDICTKYESAYSKSQKEAFAKIYQNKI
jgi:(p)ppGpp synthase/HD superfamily hydrolase